MRIGIGIFLARRLGALLSGSALPPVPVFGPGDWSLADRSVTISSWSGSGSPDAVLIRTRLSGDAWGGWTTLATSPVLPASVEHFAASPDGLYEAQIRAVEGGRQSSPSATKTLLIGDAPSAPVNSVAPAVTGTPHVGQTLSATTGTWSGTAPITYSYQWQKNGSNIGGQTASTMAVSAASPAHGDVLRCVVTATNAQGAQSANSNGVSVVLAPVNTAAPVSSGTPHVGQTLSVTQGTWSHSPGSFTYQWQKNGSNIAGQTAATMAVSAASPAHGDVLRCVVTATNAAGSASANSNGLTVVLAPANTAAPVVSGTPHLGQTLSATQGTWSNSPSSYSYQWQKNGSNLAGQTASTLSVTAASPAHGDTLRCVVTATNAAGSTPVNSNALTVVLAPAVLTPTSVSGSTQPGSTLTATNATFSNGASVSRQWFKNGAPTGVTTATYADTVDGDQVFCRTTGTNSAGSVTSDSSTVTVLAVPPPAFASGDWSVSESGINVTNWPGAGNPEDIEFRFRLT